MLDVRKQLKRSTKVGQSLRSVTKFVTLHWNGPSIGAATDLDLLKADARFHVDTRGWDGLSYHYGVGKTDIFQCRDYLARLAHSGVTQGNMESLSVLIIHGDGDKIPAVQYANLTLLLQQLAIQPRYILGHQEWPRATACPGALINRWLRDFRLTHSDSHLSNLVVTANANIRDEADVLSFRLGGVPKGARVTGTWVLGKPVKGDSLWLKGEGWAPDNDKYQYIHASALDTASYRKRII